MPTALVRMKQQVDSAAGIAPAEIAVPPKTDFLDVTLTVDDPTADPPTDAKVMLTIEAREKGGWYPVSHTWGGVSGVMMARIAVQGRRMRYHVRADQGSTVVVDVAAV